jgi:hypothetical protein
MGFQPKTIFAAGANLATVTFDTTGIGSGGISHRALSSSRKALGPGRVASRPRVTSFAYPVSKVARAQERRFLPVCRKLGSYCEARQSLEAFPEGSKLFPVTFPCMCGECRMTLPGARDRLPRRLWSVPIWDGGVLMKGLRRRGFPYHPLIPP